MLAAGCSSTSSTGPSAAASGPSGSAAGSKSSTDAAIDASGSGSDVESAGTSLDGPWHGTLEVGGQTMEIGLTFSEQGDTVSGTLDAPAQGLAGLPLTEATDDGATVSFSIDGLPGRPSFTGTRQGETISGTFTQAGQQIPLTLTRGEVTQPRRPQQPTPPFPYLSEDVAYRGDVDLAGTLTLPATGGTFPGVLLITGSGAQDRDETLAGHKPFLLLADTLTRAGYAVLRVDDRGVGGSGGSLADADFAALAGDVAAGLGYLRSRPEIDPEKIGLLGHSEGGYLAPLVAQSADVDFVILMAGPALPGDQVLLNQNRDLLQASGATPDQLQAQIDFVQEIIDRLKTGDLAGAKQLAADQVTRQGGTQQQAGAAAASIDGPFAAFVSYDPAPALSALRVPTLAVFGDKDLQVSPVDNDPAMRSLLASDGDATVQTIPGLNHLMQPAANGLPAEFATIETTIDPQVLDLFVSWLQQRFPAG